MNSERAIIFLDIDGVLNTYGHQKHQMKHTGTFDKHNWCPVACQHIFFLCRELGCRIVVSSSWRIATSLDTLRKHFAHNGIPRRYIIGKTPTIVDIERVWEDHMTENYCRGYEIKDWILSNDPDCSYIIIDDHSDMLNEQRNHLIHVDAEFGFADKQSFSQSINLLHAQHNITA